MIGSSRSHSQPNLAIALIMREAAVLRERK
jgi:hypothetical protein